jgi:hypothetical protein
VLVAVAGIETATETEEEDEDTGGNVNVGVGVERGAVETDVEINIGMDAGPDGPEFDTTGSGVVDFLLPPLNFDIL